MKSLKVSDRHEWRLDGHDWWLHYLPSDTPDEPLRIAARFEAEMLNAAKCEVDAVTAHAERAFAIADEAMYTDLRSYGVWRNQRCYVAEGMYADEYVPEAIAWLDPRGFLERGQDDAGEFVRVLRKPGDDARGVAGSGEQTFSRHTPMGGK